MNALTARRMRVPSRSIIPASTSLYHICSAISPAYLALFYSSQAQAPQRRTLWRCAHNRFESTQEENERLLLRLRRHHRHHISKLRRAGLYGDRHHADNTVYQRSQPWWHWSWGWNRTTATDTSSQHDHRERHSNRFWNKSAAQIEQEMEEWRREIERDPYTALFGRRLKPFNLLGGEGLEKSWSAFCRSFLGMGHDRDDTFARSKTAKDCPVKENVAKASASVDETTVASSPRDGTPQPTESAVYNFDPISGRMVARRDKDITSSSSATRFVNEGENGEVNIAVKVYNPPEQSEVQTVKTVAATVVESEDLKAQSDAKGDTESPLDLKCTQSGGRTLDSMVAQLSESVDAASRAKDNSVIPLPQPSTDPGRTKVSGFSQPDLVRQERLEDLDLLSASDIRNRYVGKKTLQDAELVKQRDHKQLEETYFLYRDPLDQLRAEDIRSRLREANQARGLDCQAAADSRNFENAKVAKSGTPEDPESPTAQPISASQPQESSANSDIHSATFRILAYDSTTRQVIMAEVTSSLNVPSEYPASSEILCRLSNPAQFLPYFSSLENDGYEIVSGGGDVLIFRKMRVGSGRMEGSAGIEHASPEAQAPEDVQTPRDDCQSNAFIKPQTNQSHGDMRPESSSRFVQRQETVYTGGPPNWSPYPPAAAPQPLADGTDTRQGGTGNWVVLRRMLLTGTATAATCYAIGVLVEFFRTGGTEGRGIDGFTEFESERRQIERS